ncbi:MAG: Type secretion system protein [Betaproteobacteria bacterium]|nr:Type secretion system protein [Betaproteobacteria bacterium]
MKLVRTLHLLPALSLVFAGSEAWSAEPAARPAAPSTSTSRTAGGDPVTLNFINADIEGVVKAVSEITGKNFVLDPRVKGTVNIVSAKPIQKSLVYDVFLSALRLQGFAAIEERGTVMIVPEADAKLHSSPTYGPQDKSRPAGDQMRTQVFTLKYESAAQLVPILRPLIAPNNPITAYPGGNSLVITDYASNLVRIEKIIDSIDQPSGSDGVVIPLKYASALDVAQSVNRLFAETPAGASGQAAADTSQRMTIIADTRSNSLLARSDNPSRLAKLRSLVTLLDTPTSAAGNMHVVHLRNAEAVKVAETLRAIYPGNGAGGQSKSAGALPLAATAPITMAPLPSIGTGPGGSSLAAAQAQPYTPLSFSSQAQPVAAPGIIQADAATNSIIITAPDAIYNDLRAVIDKLDTRRAQVYVEALIAEVTANKAAELGVQWQYLNGAATGSDNTKAFGGTNFGGAGTNIFGIAQNPTSAGRGLNVGVVKGSITIPGVGTISDIGFLIRALAADSSNNILSTPTLLTLDNEEARIVVGQNVPFLTGSYAVSGAATTPTPFQTVMRQDVGITLRIKPQISESGSVRLQIYQEVSTVIDNTNPAGPITNKRSVESMVLVDDGQIIVIGGLIDDNYRDTVEKVPVLGDLPLLGSLFQYKSRARVKTNLMVFLRPSVLREPHSADGVTFGRYDYIIGEQDKLRPKPGGVLPDMGLPALPPLPAAAPPAANAPR